MPYVSAQGLPMRQSEADVSHHKQIINRIDHEGLGPIKSTIPDCAYDVCSISHDAEDHGQQLWGFNSDSTQSDIDEGG